MHCFNNLVISSRNRNNAEEASLISQFSQENFPIQLVKIHLSPGLYHANIFCDKFENEMLDEYEKSKI